MSEKVRTVSCTWYSINSKMIHRGHSTLTDAISLFDVLFLVHWPFYHAQRICHSHRAMLFQRRYCCFILRKNTFKPIKRKYQAQTCAHVKKNSPACWTAFAFLYIGLHRAFAVRQVRTKTNFVYSRERVRICIDQAFSLKFWDFIFNVGIVQNLFRNVWNVAYIKVLN